ncbi:MAG: class I SAM-dependent methyltransferase [Myxococcales bacterium]|nr:class I SAM-dependent methyltransferase [Myxococcales bacterium]MDH3485763.1 class I SAM-dependent methyltransferase [Myxococcales bacterium]
MKAFVDFYTKEGISPVAQDIEDLEKHFHRRHALYRHVGIVPGLLSGRSILEFGPGSGHNSIVTAAMHPARYVLVDANPVGLEHTRDLLQRFAGSGSIDISVVQSFIEDFETSERFDLVLCEGVLPTQEAPTELLSQIARFVRSGGMILITCIDAASYLAEQLRRFAAALATHEEASTEEKLAILVPLLGPHLDTIEGMGRSHEDWILDNVIQPFQGRALMGLDEAIDALHPDFSVHGTSPSFLVDRRWYKRITGPASDFNAVANQMYLAELHNFIDARTEHSVRKRERNRSLLAACNEAYQGIVNHSEARSSAAMARVMKALEVLRSELADLDPLTVRSFDDFLRVVARLQAGERDVDWGNFASWFGQGQQYLSLVRDRPLGIPESS